VQGVYEFDMGESVFAPNCVLRYFFCVGAMRSYPPGECTLVVAVDGAHLRNHFGGTLFTFVYRDANHKLSLLASGVASAENGENSAWMMMWFRRCFPQLSVVIQDEGTGLNSGDVISVLTGVDDELMAFAGAIAVQPVENVLMASCARHAENGIKKRHGKGAVPILYSLARARTADAVAAVLNSARSYSPKLFDELDAKKERLSVFFRIHLGMTGGIITQSHAESMNNAIQIAREAGPLRMVAILIDHAAALHAERGAEHAARIEPVPPLVQSAIRENIKANKNYRIHAWHVRTKDRLEATVGKKGGSAVRIFIARGSGATQFHCPCAHWDDLGYLCPRLNFLILAAVSEE
jgi:hypothetical protein